MTYDDFTQTTLGRTGLRVGRLGISASFGAPAAAVESAFEQGVNYLYWGSRRRGGFADALRHLAPRRDRFVLVLQSYSRMASLVGWSIERALQAVRLEYADILLLGMWNKPVPPRMIEAARKLRDRGLVRFLAVSTHNRGLVPDIAGGSDFDVVHFRYNAAHPGAERDIFPNLPDSNRPGLVAFTATSWRQLLKAKNVPHGEKPPGASDCYRYVLSRPEVNVCMTGPANAAQMDHALEALKRGPMSRSELEWMRRIGKTAAGK
jgi:aryl-alcohol dehydrogenase-like predicted oxidoreductase